MRTLLAIVLLTCLSSGYSQLRKTLFETLPAKTSEWSDTEHVLICEFPSEPMPDKEWRAHLRNNLILDETSIDTIPAGTYTVFVQFMIDKEGKMGDVSIVKDPGFGLGQRVMQVVADYKGRWKPAEMHGRPVKSYRKQPVTFIVEEGEEECEDELPVGLIL